jgi:hypothetical protein
LGRVELPLLLANDVDADGDGLRIVDISEGIGGAVLRTYDGDLRFVMTSGYTGVASFTYRVFDGSAMSAPATVSIEIYEQPAVTPTPPIETPAYPVYPTPSIETPIETPTYPVYPTPPIETPIETPTHVVPLLKKYGTSGSDLIDEKHAAFGGAATDTAEEIFGSGGNDTVKALGGDDSVRGDSGDDKLYGDSGRVTIVGGSGKDMLTGGKHADTFVFNAKLGASNVDTIVDFKHDVDIIALDDRIFTKLAGSLTEAQFHAKAGTTNAHDKSDRIIYDSNTGKLYFDDDGKGGHAAVQFATLSNKAVLDHGDFAIV